MSRAGVPFRSTDVPSVSLERVFRPHRGRLVTALTVASLAAAVVLGISIGARFVPPLDVARALGSVLVPFVEITEPPAAHATIVIELRLPRVALMALTGAALAAAGAAYQGLFRNPLADPYTIGVASGAGLGATFVLSLWAPVTALGLLSVPAGAFAGGLGAVACVLAIARVGRTTPTTTTLLAGVAVGSLATSLTTFWMLRSPDGLRRAFGWLLGGYAGGGWAPVGIVAAYLALGLVLMAANARALNVLQLDEEQARQLGIDVERVKMVLIAAATLMTAAAVAFGGLIGFVGLVVPHALRLLGAQDYRRLVPLSALGGATFLILADLLARTILSPEELPVGVLTALAGAPFFVVLLRRLKRTVF